MAVNYTGTRPAPWLAKAVYQFNPDMNTYVADQIAPPISSPSDKGTLPVITRESMSFNDTSGNNTRRAPGSSYKRDDHTIEGVPYTCVGYGFEAKLPREHEAIYGGVAPGLIASTRKARGRLYQDKEFRMKNMVFDTATWTGASLYTDNSAAPWDAAGSDIIGQVTAAIDKVRQNTGMNPNAIIVPRAQYRNMIYTNTAIKGQLSSHERATPDALLEFMKALFEIENFIVAGGVYNTANKGQDYVGGDIWGDDYVQVARVATTSDPEEPCAWRQVSWQAMGAGTDMSVGSYWEDQTKSTIVQGDLYNDEIVVDKYFAHMMKVDA